MTALLRLFRSHRPASVDLARRRYTSLQIKLLAVGMAGSNGR